MTEEIAASADPPGDPPPPVPPTLPDPTQKRLTKRERQFVAEYLVDMNGAEAVRRCRWFKGHAPRQKAWRMLKRPHVRAAIEKALAEDRGRAAERGEQVKRLVLAQAVANPNELVEFRREACRYCWGLGHRQQFTPAEQERRRADYERVLVEREVKHPGAEPIAFDEMGGVGFNPKRDPHPECPECHGDGVGRVFVHDTRNLSPEVRAFYAGIKQTEKGLEVKTNSQDKAREMYLKLTGQLTDRLEHTGKGGTPLAPPVINIGFANGGPGNPAAQILAAKVRDLFFDANGHWIPSRFKAMHGGRGGLKTWGFGRVAVLLAAIRKVRFLCARELQTSIQESVHRTLVSQIEAMDLEPYFDVQKNLIRGYSGAEFIFSGIRNNPKKIKSLEGVDVCWVEEAENITEESWQIVIPTIRKPGSEIWVGFNPDLEKDPTSQRFIVNPPPAHLARIIQTNWRDNPWLSDELRADKDYLARVDQDAYQHVWEGGFRQNSQAQVLRGKISVEAFEPQIDWNGPYQGADWGFSQDPSTLVRVWISGRKLYIEHEAYGLGVDTNLLSELFDRKVPLAAQYVTRGDNARPETISYLKQHGHPKMTACTKWKGSVEDGVAYLRQFELIVIHPRCEHAIEEGRLWSYKVDRLSGDPLPDLAEGHDHIWDAVRYALQPMIRKTGGYNFTSV